MVSSSFFCVCVGFFWAVFIYGATMWFLLFCSLTSRLPSSSGKLMCVPLADTWRESLGLYENDVNPYRRYAYSRGPSLHKAV